MRQDLLMDVKNGVATISINRPEKKNAFTDDMVVQWVSWLDEYKDRDDVKVFVFTGTETSFSAGGDMGGMKNKSERTPLDAKDHLMTVTQSLARKVAEIDKPVIAAVNGLAVGGGMDIALMCDIRIASTSARFAETYAKMGLLPGVGGAYFLPQIVGSAAALDLFWTSKWVDAQQALELGLVNYVYPEEAFRDAVTDYAEKLAQAAPLAVRYIKRLVYQSAGADLNTHLDTLSSHMAIVRTSEDHKEAIAAFKEKRPAKFKGT